MYSIDLYGCLQAGYGWPAFGGHRSGRKLPVIFAGILLNDDGMKNASATYPNQFGEDMQNGIRRQDPRWVYASLAGCDGDLWWPLRRNY